MLLHFTKMHGLGNDFVVVDRIMQDVYLPPERIRRIADRHRGIGFDQLLIVEPPFEPDMDFFYRIFNANGQEVEQCGNGARCLAKFVRLRHLTYKDNIQVHTKSTKMHLQILANNQVRVNMGIPNLSPEAIGLTEVNESLSYSLSLNNGQWVSIAAVSMGNPHAVVIVDSCDDAPVAQIGHLIAHHSQFKNQCNVGFMQIQNRQQIFLRVYERGCGETNACGSGACAAVVAGITQGLLDSKVEVHLLGGVLEITWEGVGKPLYMSGVATKVYDGQIWI